jgi:hypothetical protein
MIRALAAAAAIWLVISACGNADCDKASLSLVCDYIPTGGAECVEFSRLSTADSKSANAACITRGGNPDAGVCAAGDIGTCSLPNNASNIDIGCSPNGVITAHYYAGTPPNGFSTASAQTSCTSVKGATFTPH